MNWFDDAQEQIVEGERRILTGSPIQVAADIDALEDLGVNHLMLNFQGSDLKETFDLLARFTEGVRPLTASS